MKIVRNEKNNLLAPMKSRGHNMPPSTNLYAAPRIVVGLPPKKKIGQCDIIIKLIVTTPLPCQPQNKGMFFHF